MATLRANGRCVIEYTKRSTIDDDSGHRDVTEVVRIMESNKILKKVTIVADGKKYTWGWKVLGRVKAHLRGNERAIRDAVAVHVDMMRAKGRDVEITQ